MSKKQILDLINEGFGNLYPLTCKTYTDYRAEMLDYEVKQEKQHRRMAPSGFGPRLTVRHIAKYFVLRSVRSAMLSNDFRPRDILHCKHSFILAHAIKDDDRFDLNAMFASFDWSAFESIEYSQGDLIVKTDAVEVAA